MTTLRELCDSVFDSKFDNTETEISKEEMNKCKNLLDNLKPWLKEHWPTYDEVREDFTNQISEELEVLFKLTFK